jgi:hypothetical protein
MKESLKQISDLVERFESNIEAYRSPAYNETQLRIEFVDPFFEALGWDVTNKPWQVLTLFLFLAIQ